MATPPLSFQPSFIKGHLRVSFNEEKIEFFYQPVLLSGVGGLPSSPFTERFFGRIVNVALELLTKPVTLLNLQARVLRERTAKTESLALKFMLDETVRKELTHLLRLHGTQLPKEKRKYPRIPSLELIEVFPLRATAIPLADLAASNSPPLITDVVNLSPGGVLLSCSSSGAEILVPGSRLSITLESRGWFPLPITFEGTVRRITEDRDSKTRNPSFLFGIQFLKMDVANKTAFLDLLKEILTQIQKNS